MVLEERGELGSISEGRKLIGRRSKSKKKVSGSRI